MRFSVVVPTFNRRQMLGATIDSVLTQGVEDVELLIVDDGSTDGTEAWLAQEYAHRRQIRFMRNARAKGPAGARNTGILAAQGDFVALLDSDDTFAPGHLEECAALFARAPDVDVIFGRAVYERNGVEEAYMGPNFERKLAAAPTLRSDDTSSVFNPTFFGHLLEHGCWFNLSTVVLRRDAALELMDERLRISEDYEFWVRLARTRRFGCLHSPQIRYALHDSNISFDAQATASDNAPHLLKALETIRSYTSIDAGSVALIDRQVADILFDWGYRCAVRGQPRESLRLHLASMRRGKRAANLWAIIKTPATIVLRKR